MFSASSVDIGASPSVTIGPRSAIANAPHHALNPSKTQAKACFHNPGDSNCTCEWFAVKNPCLVCIGGISDAAAPVPRNHHRQDRARGRGKPAPQPSPRGVTFVSGAPREWLVAPVMRRMGDGIVVGGIFFARKWIG